jgi:hypothetical protein
VASPLGVENIALALATVIVELTISLDGFVADQNSNAGRLYPDLAALRYTAYIKDAIVPLISTVAGICGTPASPFGVARR